MIRCSLALAAMIGCSHSAPAPDQPGAPAPAPTTDDPTCPVLVPGTSVTVEDTPTGAALVFVTTGDSSKVHQRAAMLAEMHARHDGAPSAMGMMIATPSTAAVSDVAGGAKVTFTASAEDVGALQSELRMHAQHLAGGNCTMAM